MVICALSHLVFSLIGPSAISGLDFTGLGPNIEVGHKQLIYLFNLNNWKNYIIRHVHGVPYTSSR